MSRFPTRSNRPAILAILIVAGLPALASTASASNMRVSISNYAWSSKQVHIDLNEKVTWDWLGPDLAHSVTGISANDRGWDSDPNTDAPYHPPGYTYTIQFAQPGAYAFQCKLHPFLRGEVPTTTASARTASAHTAATRRGRPQPVSTTWPLAPARSASRPALEPTKPSCAQATARPIPPSP